MSLKSLIVGLALSSAAALGEETNSVLAPLSNTTLSGFVDTSAFAAPQFNANSARITHPYFHLFAGSKFIYSGSGGSSGATLTITAVAEEIVDGVRTLKVTDSLTGEPLIVNWLAQDTQGNVWCLRSIDGGRREQDFLKLPATLAPGVTFSTEFNDQVTVAETGLTLQTAFAIYQNVIRLHLVETSIPGSTYRENYYLAPGVGIVRATDHENGQQLGTLDLRTAIQTRPITVITDGKGTVTYKNGQLLQVGKQYYATAVAAPGYAFREWFAPMPSQTSKINFTMDLAGMTLHARFADIAKPTLFVAQPRNNARVQIPEITVGGTARDNDFLAAVRLQLNDGEWNPIGASNWSASVTLTPGPNKIRVYAIDNAGNRSITNVLTVTYVKSHPFNVSIFGKGGLSPNLNGKLLEVGKNYSVTAVPAALSRFVNWSGDLQGTAARLNFTMPDQPLNLTATFVDSGRPGIVITSPKPNERVITNRMTFAGKASDNIGVQRVLLNLDNTGWIEAQGTTNWLSVADLGLGSHTLKAYSEDAAGNRSTTNTVTFRVPDYRGVYFGSYSEPLGRGLVGVLVTSDQKIVVIAGDTTSDFDSATVIDFMDLAINGKFDQTIEGERTYGTFTDTGFAGKFITTDQMTGNFSGARKPATGAHANNAGYYVGTYQMPGETGVARAMLAPNGQILITVLSEPLPGENGDRAGGAGMGTLSISSNLTANVGGAPIRGTLNGFNISGTFQAESGQGTFQMTRVASPGSPRTMEIVGSNQSPGSVSPPPPPLTSETIYHPTPVGSVEVREPIAPVAIASVEVVAPLAAPVPVQPILAPIAAQGGFGFAFTTEIGLRYRVQASYDLTNWVDLVEPFTATADQYDFTDPEVLDNHRFYRVVAE